MRKLLTIFMLTVSLNGLRAQGFGSDGIGLRTNILYDVALVPNIGVEWGVRDQWTMVANGMYVWWKNDPRHRYWRIASADLELRRWLGSRFNNYLRKGLHAGAYVAAYRYDLEFGGEGQMGDFNWGFGATLGYAVPLARKLSLDFNLGVGYIGGPYKKYVPIDDCYVWQSDRWRWYFGPTKAEITLVWHIELQGRGGGSW